jgi:hypothetical protein
MQHDKAKLFQKLALNIQPCHDLIDGIPITEKMVKDFGYFIIETNKCVEAFRDNFRYSIQQVENPNIGFGVMENCYH